MRQQNNLSLPDIYLLPWLKLLICRCGKGTIMSIHIFQHIFVIG